VERIEATAASKLIAEGIERTFALIAWPTNSSLVRYLWGNTWIISAEFGIASTLTT